MGVLPNARRINTHVPTTFSWDAVGGADSYQIELGYTSGGSEYLVVNVGNVTSYTRSLPRGTYYQRVKAVASGVPGTASIEHLVTIP